MNSLNKLAFIAASFGAVGMASASIIDFNGFAANTFTNPVNVGDFTFSYNAAGFGILTDGYTSGSRVFVHNGTTRLAITGIKNGDNARVMFKPTDDSPFSLQQLDAATFLAAKTGGFDVIGTYEGGGTVTASFSTIDSFATYALPDTFVNLDSVLVRNQFGGTAFNDAGGVIIDNIVVNQPVPEPATLATFGLALAAFAKRRRKS